MKCKILLILSTKMSTGHTGVKIYQDSSSL